MSGVLGRNEGTPPTPTVAAARSPSLREEPSQDGLPLATWVRSTTLGWAMGVPAIVLLAAVAESLGEQGLHTPVGAGMGLTVGYFQYRVLRARLDDAAPWFWSCLVGLSAPFLAVDLAGVAGVSLPYSLSASVVCGGLILGLWQTVLLRPPSGRVAWWVTASVLGWTLASGSVALADFLVRSRALKGIPGALTYLALVASGGVLLAVVTGFPLVRLLRPETRFQNGRSRGIA